MKNNNASAAERLKHWRADRHITQRDLARYLGVSPATIAYWESGGILPRREQLMRLALSYYDTVNPGGQCHG